MSERVVVGMTGATGQIYGIKALEMLADRSWETHLVVSESAKINIRQETEYTPGEVSELATESYDNRDIGAPMSSGSFRTAGMIVAPCSMRTLSNVATGNSGNLIARAADVTLKERRDLVLLPREKPFNRIHLENMLTVTDAGAVIMPPFPSFYHHPEDVDEMVRRTVARSLGLLGLEVDIDEWRGVSSSLPADSRPGGPPPPVPPPRRPYRVT